LRPAIPTDRVSFLISSGEVHVGGRPSDRFRQAGVAGSGCWREFSAHLFAYKYFFGRSPEASVNFFKCPREKPSQSTEFRHQPSVRTSAGYNRQLSFDVDDNAKVYLERELGLEQANKLHVLRAEYLVLGRAFLKRSRKRNPCSASAPAGQIVGYDHKVEEATGGDAKPPPGADPRAGLSQRETRRRFACVGRFTGEANRRICRTPGRLVVHLGKHGFRARDAPTDCASRFMPIRSAAAKSS